MKYVLGIVGIFFVLIIAIVLIFGGGDGPTNREKLIISEQAREGVSAVLTTEGQLVGENQRRAIRIIINQNERRLEVLTGYGQAVEQSSTFPNTTAAFEFFLAGLEKAGFDNKRPTSIKDERGICPLGRIYHYELREYSQELLGSWNTSCSSKIGNFDGRGRLIRTLFQSQFDNYSELTRDVSLRGRNK